MKTLKNILKHPTMILANDVAAFLVLVALSLAFALALFSWFVGAPCPECTQLLHAPQLVIAPWIESLF
jgi:hypothetical protein